MAWIETYRPIRDLTPVFCIARKDDLTVFLPLVLWKQNWKNAFRKLIIPVGYSDFDYHDPVTSGILNPEGWTSYYKALTDKLGSKIKFDEIYIDGLRNEVTNLNLYLSDKEVAPFLNLTGYADEKDLLGSLKGSLRGDLLRQIRRIESRGEMSLQKIETLNESLSLLPILLKLHSERWPLSFKAPLFHENILKAGVERGIVDFTILKAGDSILSYNIGFTFNDIYYYYMPVIDPDYENFSPGKVHLYLLIKSSFENRFRGFDHLHGNESYKLDWSNEIKPLFRFNIVKRNIFSELKHLLILTKAMIN
jgi:hypothetical protein